MNSLISIRENDRRVSPRIDCAIQAELGDGVLCEILDLSMGGAFLAVPVAPPAENLLIISFTLADPTPGSLEPERHIRMRGQVRRTKRLQNGGFGIGIQFQDPAPGDQEFVRRYVLRQVISDIVEVVERQTIELDPADLSLVHELEPVLELLDAMLKERTELSVFQRGVGEILGGKLAAVTPGRITLRLNGMPTEPLSGGRIHISFTRHHFNFYFNAEVDGLENGALHFRPPESIFSYDLRKSPRSRPSGSHNRIEIPLPYPPGALLSRPVIDISSDGLAFRSPANDSYFLPGTPLREIRIFAASDAPPISRSGQVMHVTPLEENGRVEFLKIGVEFGIQDLALRHGRTPKAPPAQEMSFFARMASFVKHLTSRKLLGGRTGTPEHLVNPIEVIRYANHRKEEIVAILNTTTRDDQRLHAPLVIIPPAHGKRKESTSALAMTLIENFKRRKKDLVVLRYDGVRNLGESYKDADARVPGLEALHWTISQAVDDLQTTLDYSYDNPRFYPTEVIVISPSLQAVPTRKVLALDKQHRVHYWISLMGVPALQEVIRNTSGGIDYIANHARGIRCGIAQILGMTGDMDGFAADALNNGLAFVGEACRDMGQIDVPITWFYGRYDAWVDPSSVQELMEVPSRAPRQVLELPAGHIPLMGPEAIQCFGEITRHLWRFLTGDEIEPVFPPVEEIKRTRRLEWARAPKFKLNDRKAYWRDYLLGSGPNAIGYDLFELSDEYTAFVKRQVELLDLKAGHSYADLGCGTGCLSHLLFERFGGRKAWKLSKVTLVDLVPEALQKAQRKLERLAQTSGQQLPPIDPRTLNLQMSPIRALRRFLQGEFFGYDPLKGVVPGLSDYSIEVWKRLADWRLHGLLRGRPLNEEDRNFLNAMLPPSEQQALVEFNRLARFVQNQAGPDDFKTRGSVPDSKNALTQLKLEVLKPWATGELLERLPFEDESFDRIICSLVLSYLDNPAETLSEFVRCLRPGGRIVFSSMMPDVDTGRIYMNVLRKIETTPNLELPDGLSRDVLLNAVRTHLNSIASLLQIAEEGQFTFFSKDEVRQLAERSGLSRIETFASYGDPPQAYITVGYKA